MAELDENIKRINSKLQQLLKQYQFLQKDNEQKNNEIAELKEANIGHLKRLSELEQQALILKSAKSDMTGKDKSEFEKRINQYIKEINKCISLLSE